MKKLARFIAFLMLLPGIAAAESEEVAIDSSSLDEDAIAVYASACEKIKDSEAKSSVRVRATDKAAFSAVESISLLNEIKDSTNPHDFNVLVYNLVDNYLEDMNVRTTRQDEEQVCVEVTGYIKNTYILDAVNNAQNDNKLQIKNQEEAEEKTLQPQAPAEKPLKPADEPPAVENDKRALVYIAPAKFYNGTVSEQHAGILKEMFRPSKYLYITEQSELADYIIRPQVLRAKVDPINSNTNRLQMVVSVSGEFVDKESTTTEHQNRFVLFSSDDNEQSVAADLLKKLLEKAAEPIFNKIENSERKKQSNAFLPDIITPAVPAVQP